MYVKCEFPLCTAKARHPAPRCYSHFPAQGPGWHSPPLGACRCQARGGGCPRTPSLLPCQPGSMQSRRDRVFRQHPECLARSLGRQRLAGKGGGVFAWREGLPRPRGGGQTAELSPIDALCAEEARNRPACCPPLVGALPRSAGRAGRGGSAQGLPCAPAELSFPAPGRPASGTPGGVCGGRALRVEAPSPISCPGGGAAPAARLGVCTGLTGAGR